MKIKCLQCNEKKELKEFPKNKDGKYGVKNFCKPCHSKNQQKRTLKYPERSLLCNAKKRAKQKGIPFNLTEDDIVVPKVCPVFKKSFVFSAGKTNDFSISLDRIDNTKGYLKDNIIVVSMKANQIKNNATIEELRILTDFYESL